MATGYEIILADQLGNHIAQFNNFARLEWGRRVNDVGAFLLTFDADQFSRDLWWGLDRRLEIWRKPETGEMTLAMMGFLRYLKRGRDAQGRRYVTLGGPDQNDLLTRRIIAYAAASSQAAKKGYAGNVIKAFVRENLGSLATDSDRDLTSYGFRVQRNLSDGATVEIAASRRKLLAVIQEVAEASYNQGSPLYFDITYIPTETFRFSTYAGQRGVDRTWANKQNAILLSAEMGNLRQPELMQDWREELTVVYAGWQGKEDNRRVQEIPATARLSKSVFNRREGMYSGQSSETPQQCAAGARAKLRENKPVRKFTAEAVDRESFRFGKDWDFGDKLTASFGSEQYGVMVSAVHVVVTDDAGEVVTPKLEYLE
jgi:hypothetical protein